VKKSELTDTDMNEIWRDITYEGTDYQRAASSGVINDENQEIGTYLDQKLHNLHIGYQKDARTCSSSFDIDHRLTML
jgi:hypothetical protein